MRRLCERDSRDEAPIIGFLAMGRAAIAEEARLIAVCVETEIFESGDAAPRDPHADETVQVEHRTIGIDAGRKKMAGVGFGLNGM